MTDRPRRSALYLPASNARAIEKARTLECDVVILDLEDAVAPDLKSLARDQAVAAVRDGGFGRRELVVRVNGLDTLWGEDDLTALAQASPDAILAPKVSDVATIEAYGARLATGTPLWVMIETAISLFRLEAMAATARTGPLAGFVLGTNDLAAEMGVQTDALRAPFVGAMGLAVAAARAHRLIILDGVFNALDDLEGFETQTRQALEFGFDGKTLIHPSQIAPCNAIFRPDARQVAAAQTIVDAFADPANADKGAIRLDGRMVERLHLRQAERTLAAVRV
ncbi:(3S)-malyl-CoA thioesterase [Brevundimonas sp. NIBR10]|uniref:HpcH/HpaI aldolase/citrate lyase family protein n=1 Tax=Brevundimonas sp. NIBR10 TaxID=3015997 RepID=UPI0022F1D118|nr:CoA ester lyase [Brevundimonas sp. NIBR10]WGM48337.1 (3S)-malyl-CoA thioesterase [Brevundimonas sp. NIBR10]